MNTNEWIEQFTGLQLSDGERNDQPDPEALTRQLEEERALKRLLLDKAREKINGVKADFQKAMAEEVKIKGKIFKQRMLVVEGTQLDELDVEEFDYADLELEKKTQDAISLGSAIITNTGANLAGEMIKRGDKMEPLFTEPELTEAYWFPLTRERILPETLAPDIYSKTRKMLDETNELLLAGTEIKREKGELTPKANRVRDLVQSGAELMSVGADLAGTFGAGTEQAKLAGQVLSMLSSVVQGGGEVYDKVKAREYADGASAFLGTVKLVTGSILKSVGVDKEVVALVEKGFVAGGAAITAGKHFARGADGVGDGVGVLGGLLQTILQTVAETATKDKATQQALHAAAISLGTTIKGAGTSVKLLQAVDAGDSAAAFDCLGTLATNTLNGVQDLRKIGATESQIKEIDKQTKTGEQGIALSTLGLKTTAAVAISLKRGSYQKAFDTLILAVGDGLVTALTLAQLPAAEAKKIAVLYQSAVSGVQALECMMSDEPDVAGALQKFGAGFSTALNAVAPGNDKVGKAAEGIARSFAGLADVATIKKLYAEGKYDEALVTFTTGVSSQLKGVLEVGDLMDAIAGAKELIASKVDDALEDQVTAVAKAEAREEAEALLEEAEADLKAFAGRAPNTGELSDAEALAREASDIERLIAKMQRDQMIMKVAMQIMQGGTAFLASFVPALGAASAALKMVASMQAAAARAQQLHSWVNSKQDFASAQSALTSSAQNFVKNQAEQFTHHSIQAAFAAAELIGNVIDLAGAPAMGAGPAVGASIKAAAKAGAKIEEIIYKHAKKEELEYAWRLTKRSLNNPSNRKLGLRARAVNPTLAKYSIAWGAVTQNDPLARNALRACDLTDAVLESPNANVHKVVEYLETFYEEDDKLYRELETNAKWVPAELTLTLRCWARLKANAVESIKLANPDTGVIDGYLAQLRVDVTQLDLGGLATRSAVLVKLKVELNQYAPSAPEPKDVQAFKSAVKLLSKQVDAASASVKKHRDTLEKKKADQEKALKQAVEQGGKVASDALKIVALTDGKADEELAEKLKDAVFVQTELEGVRGGLKSLSSDDEPEDLVEPLEAARKVLKEVAGTEAVASVQVVKDVLEEVRELVKLVELRIESEAETV